MDGGTSLGKVGGGDVAILICYLSKYRFFKYWKGDLGKLYGMEYLRIVHRNLGSVGW